MLWGLAACLLLILGFAAVVVAYFLFARWMGTIPDDRIRVFQTGLAIYFRIVFLKALVPQLILTLSLWPAAVRMLPSVLSSRSRMLGGLLLTSALAYGVVAPLLLTVAFDGFPALRMENAQDQLGSAALIVAGVALAAWVPRALRFGRR